MNHSNCDICDLNQNSVFKKLGELKGKSDFSIALAGNPNTGKSTIFNALTGLKQHTGNWPGKTVSNAQGNFSFNQSNYKLIDLPGTYSLLSTSDDEEVARDYILFGKPDVTVVVVDAGRLERHLSLVMQIQQINAKVIVCLNLMDEASRHGVEIDIRGLSRDLGVPVIATSARSKKGITELLQAIDQMAKGHTPYINVNKGVFEDAGGPIQQIAHKISELDSTLQSNYWIALRLIQQDKNIELALKTQGLSLKISTEQANEIITLAHKYSKDFAFSYNDNLAQTIFKRVGEIVSSTVKTPDTSRAIRIDRAIDNIVTSRRYGFPLMLLILGVILWLTIIGSNYPSSFLSYLLVDKGYLLLKQVSLWANVPWWIDGFLIDGIYLATAWVIAVMLPPMAIFFPLFTLLEDFGYLPRVAFNLDRMFRSSGAHGKQALTMSMGFGCNAAGVVATRIINSPREKLVAIITNNFSLCNGRWPTQILMATIFIGALVPTYLAHTISTLAVVGIVVLGIGFTFLSSWMLSRTLLKGETSFFTLELPPYRPPHFWQTVYTSLIDRTLIVLGRAVIFAAPAGAAIWLISNISIADQSMAIWAIDWLNPLGIFLGLNGVILLAYIVAIPANEIVIPTVLMLTVLTLGNPALGQGAGVMFEVSDAQIADILQMAGWTTLTGINLMLFSLLHNPCSTTIYTIYKETNSVKWTFVATVLPIVFGVILCIITTQISYLF